MRRLFYLLILLFSLGVITQAQATFTPNCNGTNDTAAFSALIVTIGSNQGTIRLPYKPGSRCAVNTLTIPSNVTLDNTSGTGLKINSSQVLTVNGPRVNPAGKTFFYGPGTWVLNGYTYLTNSPADTSTTSAVTGFVTPQQYGAVCDGNLHPLSATYGTLGAAQAVYPFITSLTQQLDYAALKQASNIAFGPDKVVGTIGSYITMDGSSTTTLIIDNVTTYTINALTGQTLYLRYPNAFVASTTILSNTVHSITLSPALPYDFHNGPGVVCGFGQTYDCSAYAIGTGSAGEHGDANSFLNKPLYIPAGTCELGNDTWLIRNASGVHIYGAGQRATKLQANGWVFRTDGLWYARIEGIEFDSLTSTAGHGAVDIDGNVPGHPYDTRTVQGNTFDQCKFNGGGSTYAFALNRQGGSSAQGENLYSNCYWQSATVAYYQNGFNALNNLILRGDMQDYTTGVYIGAGSVRVLGTSVESTRGYAQISDTSFVAQGGFDFDCSASGVGEPIVIEGVRSESLRFFRGSSAQTGVLIGNQTTCGGCTNWSALGNYTLNQIIHKDSVSAGHKIYRVTTAGTTGASEPTWPNSGTVADGSIVWTELEYNVVDTATAGAISFVPPNVFQTGNYQIGRYSNSPIIFSSNNVLVAGNTYADPSITYYIDTSGGNKTFELSSGVRVPEGQTVTIKKTTTDANTVTVSSTFGNACFDNTAGTVVIPGGSQGYATFQFNSTPGITTCWWVTNKSFGLNTGTYNVKNYGALGNNSTNDVAAFRLAVAAVNAAGGGTIEVPDGIYRLQLGQPTVDTNWTLINSGIYGALRITVNNVAIKLSPNATIRVIATYISQNAAGTDGPYQQNLIYFGDGATALSGFKCSGGKWTWEAGGAAVLTEVLNGGNSFDLAGGAVRDFVFRDMVVQDFPRVIPALIGYTSGGQTFNDGLFDNVNIPNYGGSGHDNAFYVQGRTIFRDCRVISTRTFQSHGIYTGADRPFTQIKGVYFEGINTTAKYGVHLYGSAGTALSDIAVSYCTFKNVLNGILVQHTNVAERINLTHNKFYGASATAGGGMVLQGLKESDISDNEFYTIGSPINAGGLESSTIKGNTFRSVQAAIALNNSISTLTGNTITGNNFSIVSAQCFSLGSVTDTTIAANTFLSSNSNAVFLQISGTSSRIAISGNTVYGTSGFAGVYSPSGTLTSIRITDNTFDIPGYSINLATGVDITLVNNQVLGTTLNLPNTMTGPCLIKGNGFTATASVTLGCPGTTLLNNEIPNGIAVSTGVTRAQGNLIVGVLDTTSPAYAATYTPNAGLYRTVIMGALTGGITINAPTNPYTGAELEFIFTQDATGTRVVTWDAVFKTNWTPDTTAAKVNTIRFRYNSVAAKWLQTAGVTGL